MVLQSCEHCKDKDLEYIYAEGIAAEDIVRCKKCGLVQDKERKAEFLARTDFHGDSDTNSTVDEDEFVRPGTGGIRHFKAANKSGKLDPDQIKSIKRAQVYVREEKTEKQRQRERASVKKALRLFYDSITLYYDTKHLKEDEAKLTNRILNLTDILGNRLDDILIANCVSKFINDKVEERPAFYQYFDVRVIATKKRWKQRESRNISGRGNQIGKKRSGYKKTRPDHCIKCNVDFGPGNWCRSHGIKFHPEIPYHQYKDPRYGYVTVPCVAEEPEGVILDCSKFKEDELSKKNKKEFGLCRRCNYDNAIIERRELVIKGNKVERLRARHKDPSGKWITCHIKQRRACLGVNSTQSN
ncbi:MAG: hypothetical protein KGI10_07635 [Thaumarchaeota archaeon]|nr:hypothetical protein [Nitrososphaerota archaeon]